MKGQLAKIGSFKLRNRQREQTINLNRILIENSMAEPGDHELDVYAALDEGFAVIDLNSGADDHVEQ